MKMSDHRNTGSSFLRCMGFIEMWILMPRLSRPGQFASGVRAIRLHA